MLKKTFVFVALFLGTLGLYLTGVSADETESVQKLNTGIEISTGGQVDYLSDNECTTKVNLSTGTQIRISSDQLIDSLYIVWDQIPGQWQLQINGKSYTYGKNNFLHEFVTLPVQTNELTIVITGESTVLCDVSAFPKGQLPSWVQNWSNPCEKADIIVFSTHADDEQLFFGGLIAYYAGEVKASVQVVYLVQYWTGPYASPQRNHEALNGLWTIGVTNYPVVGEFEDYYSRERGTDKSPALALAETQYDTDAVLKYVVEQIRRFKPQVAVGHDVINGEYGHGAHMLFAKKLVEALDVSNVASYDPESASKYGVWDVPKTYLHLYPENTINLNLRVPLASFGGKTALDVAKEGFNCHKSQLYIDIAKVDDEYYLSCAKFGLYRSLVGADTGKNDILENITLYKNQEVETQETSTEKIDSEVGKNPKGNYYIFFVAGAAVLIILFMVIVSVNNKKKRKRY